MRLPKVRAAERGHARAICDSGSPARGESIVPHPLQKVLQALTRLVGETLGSDARIDDAVQAEVPKVLAQLAPRGESPDVAPEIQAEWAHLPLSGPGGGILVFEIRKPLSGDRLPQRVEPFTGL